MSVVGQVGKVADAVDTIKEAFPRCALLYTEGKNEEWSQNSTTEALG